MNTPHTRRGCCVLCSRCSGQWEGTWAVPGEEERGMLEEGVQMACVVFLLGREGSASAAWGDFNTTTPPQPFHPWQILFLLNPTKRGSSFHSSQRCLSWLGTVSLCLPRQKVRPSPKNSMTGKGKTVSLCCLSSPALSLDLPALRGQPKAPFQTLEHKEQQLHTQCLQGLSLLCERKGCLTQTHSAPGM